MIELLPTCWRVRTVSTERQRHGDGHKKTANLQYCWASRQVPYVGEGGMAAGMSPPHSGMHLFRSAGAGVFLPRPGCKGGAPYRDLCKSWALEFMY